MMQVNKMKTIYKDHNDVSVNCELEGHVYGVYVNNKFESNIPVGLQRLQFQNGPIKEVGINGIQNEHLIAILIDRLKFLNNKFPCRENSIAITKLEESLMWLEKRTQDRIQRNVEGENKL